MHRLTAPLVALICALAAPVCMAAAPALVPYSSKVNPYSISYPAGWRHFSGHLGGAFSLFSFDEFYDPARSQGFNVNLVVAQLPVASALTTAEYTRESEQSLRNKGLQVRQTGTELVAGRRVPLVSYVDTRAHLQAYLVAARHVWVFSLTTARGDSARWASTFSAMLGSVRLR
jgi:hypothetical protein